MHLKKKARKEKNESINEESKFLFSWEAKTGLRASEFIQPTAHARRVTQPKQGFPFLTLRREVPLVALPTNNLTPADA
jgi:hypothetical protein